MMTSPPRNRFAGSRRASEVAGDDHSYQDVMARLRAQLTPGEGWRVDLREVWCVLTPPGAGLRAQGWKIHLSATPRSAERVLSAAARVLLPRRVAFKFARDPGRLRSLLSVRMDRGAAGKFVTVYPDDDTQFVRLLEALHEATEGLEGPAILSDRRYRPDSVVHYRYGGFGGIPNRLQDEGSYVPVLVAPDGSWLQDKRNAWFSPPPWATLPALSAAAASTGTARASTGDGTPPSVLLGGRFLVREAIRHSNRGGVYRALDRHDGDREVVLKEARPHVEAHADGTDVRDRLRHEHRVLSLLEPLGLAVRPVDLFEYQGHVFLAEEEVPGTNLRTWAREQVQREPDRSRTYQQVLPTARLLVELVAAVHDKGLVLRDFSPANVMVTPEGTLVLVDTEYVAAAGDPVGRVGTPGFMAPEASDGPERVPAAPAGDLYSLGAVLFQLCTGSAPYLPAGRPGSVHGLSPRSHDERIGDLVRSVSVDSPALASLAPLITGLMRQEPARRLAPAQVLDALSVPPATAKAAEATTPAPAVVDRLLTDGLDELVAALTPDSERAPWPSPAVDGLRFDPFAVHAGAAGTLEVLRRGALSGHGGSRLLPALRTALTWMDERADREQRQLPGLYFGRAGTYWAMYEAADTLGDEEIRRRAVRRAKQLPVVWHTADITHGLAGNGLAQLHLWRRTGDEEFRDRAERCAVQLLGARTAQGRRWLEPDELGGTSNAGDFGFAHGIAGIGTFLLAAARDLGREDLLDAAVRSGRLLLSLAREDGAGVGWPAADPADGSRAPLSYSCGWCNGAPGIGTFLVRLWQATGDSRLRDAAHRAAASARRQKWLLGHTHCHGLAGNGEFLLDMAAFTGDSSYREWAAEHVTALRRFCALREGRLVVVAESGSTDMLYSYNLGMAGPLGFLHRFHHGGQRWWMADETTTER